MYNVLRQSDITFCDVDNTLIYWRTDANNEAPGTIKLRYGDEDVWLRPHKFHPRLVKHFYNRGDYVIVWSQNGYEWAEQVVKALGLQNHVHLIMDKGNRHIDDKEDLTSIVGSRIFIEDDVE